MDYVLSSGKCYKHFENDECCLQMFPKVTDKRQTQSKATPSPLAYVPHRLSHNAVLLKCT